MTRSTEYLTTGVQKHIGIRAVKVQRLKRLAWLLLRVSLLVGLSFVLIYPFIYLFSISFRPWQQMTDPIVIWVPKSLTTQNMQDAIAGLRFADALVETLFISVGSSLLQVFSCAVAGYGLSRFRFPGKGVLLFMLFFIIIVPPQTYTIPLYLHFRFFDFFGIGSLIGLITGQKLSVPLLDTYWSFFVPAALASGIRGALFVFVYKQFFAGMPTELEDAAYIDGCGFTRTFFAIFVPLSTGAFLTVFLFSLVWYWNDYYFASLFFQSADTLTVRLTALSSWLTDATQVDVEIQQTIRGSVIEMAGCLLVVAPLLLIYIALQRYFTESIERTGLVG